MNAINYWYQKYLKIKKEQQNVIKETEDLEEVIEEYSEKERIAKAQTESPFFSPNDFARGFKVGSQWKEQQMQDVIKTAEDHAYFAGSESMREKMMGKAVEWLEDNIYEYIIDNSHCGGRGAFLINSKLFKDLKQAMSNNIKDK